MDSATPGALRCSSGLVSASGTISAYFGRRRQTPVNKHNNHHPHQRLASHVFLVTIRNTSFSRIKKDIVNLFILLITFPIITVSFRNQARALPWRHTSTLSIRASGAPRSKSRPTHISAVFWRKRARSSSWMQISILSSESVLAYFVVLSFGSCLLPRSSL